MPSRRQCKCDAKATRKSLTEPHNDRERQKQKPPIFLNPYNAEVISLSNHSLGRLTSSKSEHQRGLWRQTTAWNTPGEHNLVSHVRKLVSPPTVITHGSLAPGLVNEITKNCNFMIGYSCHPFATMWLVHFQRGIIMMWTSCNTANWYVIYNATYHILICRQCGYGIPQDWILGHYREIHKAIPLTIHSEIVEHRRSLVLWNVYSSWNRIGYWDPGYHQVIINHTIHPVYHTSQRSICPFNSISFNPSPSSSSGLFIYINSVSLRTLKSTYHHSINTGLEKSKNQSCLSF